jgi:hypothetical protein
VLANWGWAVFSEDGFADGSIYFADDGLQPLPENDVTIIYTKKLHNLPVNVNLSETRSRSARTQSESSLQSRGHKLFVSSSELLRTIRRLYDIVSSLTAVPKEVIVVHKGGNEGLWASMAVRGCRTMDLATHGCPKAETLYKLSRLNKGWPLDSGTCDMHEGDRPKKLTHCPRFELRLLIMWMQLQQQHTRGQPTGAEQCNASADTRVGRVQSRS